MPCRDGGPPSYEEAQYARLKGFLKECGLTTEGCSGPWDNDSMASELCAWCQTHDVKAKSLELQIWWRDHQEFDRVRIEAEAQDAKTEELRKQALYKLSPEEQQALGLRR